MQAAMRLALRGGFAAMTVRQIAREAQVAAGQLHHHFTSIGELKAQVFIRLIRDRLGVWQFGVGEFRSAEPAADIAWRFIALVCGLDGIYALDAQALDEAAFSRYVNKMITLELF